jgi:hypothetical protein
LGVAVNNGIVYVSNRQDVGGKPGEVVVYARDHNKPTSTLTDSNINLAFYPAVDDAGNVYLTYFTSSFVGEIDEWVGGGGQASNLGIQLKGPGGIETTADGSILVCDTGFGGPAMCGQFPPGSTTMINVFATTEMDPINASLNQSGTIAFTVDPAYALVDAWTYPGPDSAPLFEKTVGVEPGSDFVATSPANPAGTPY